MLRRNIKEKHIEKVIRKRNTNTSFLKHTEKNNERSEIHIVKRKQNQ